MEEVGSRKRQQAPLQAQEMEVIYDSITMFQLN